MWKFISLMLICSSANAAMYSCVDENGAKTLKNFPCEQREMQYEIAKVKEASYSIIDRTGERQDYRSGESAKSVTQAQATPPQAIPAGGGSGRSSRSTAPDSVESRILEAKVAAQNVTPQQFRDWVDNGGSPDNRSFRAAHAMSALAGETTPTDYPTPSFNPAPAFSIPELPSQFSIPEPSPTMPSKITNCDLAGCRDDLGGRYNHIGGDMYSSPSGNCQVVGNFMRCP